MSGRHAISIRITDDALEGCEQVTLDACHALAETLVHAAGGVIAGSKPSAIFTLPMRVFCGGRWRQLTRKSIDEVLRAYAEVLPSYGVRLSVLYRTERRVYLLIWRPCQLSNHATSPQCLAILREQGYTGDSGDELVQELRRRLVGYYLAPKESKAAFPHEIGVFLGYPAEDVRGFIEGREATCRGAWHAYGDVRVAKRRFEALRSQERACRMRFAAGEPLHALFAAQPA